jgi:PKD repeat protein
MKNTSNLLIAILSLLLIVNGCKKEDEIIAPSSLSYSNSSTTVISGTGITIDAPTLEGTGTITYSIATSPSSSEITIESASGKIIASGMVSVGEYTITVTASNSEGSTTTIYTIIVEEILAAPTQLVYSPSSSTITGGASWSSASPSVAGTVPIVYSLASSPMSSEISIDSSTGVITCSQNLTIDSYTLTVTATNSEGSISDTYHITVSASVVLVSFATDIKPLIQNNCDGCHLPGGSRRDYSDYTNASSWASSIVSRINKNQGESGFMPAYGTKLNQSELDLVQQWINDGLQQ